MSQDTSTHRSRSKDRKHSSPSRTPVGDVPAGGVPIQCQYCSGQLFRRSRLRSEDLRQILLIVTPYAASAAVNGRWSASPWPACLSPPTPNTSAPFAPRTRGNTGQNAATTAAPSTPSHHDPTSNHAALKRNPSRMNRPKR
jgi:hypothetical protein